jgi:tripartite-type tricarboxylate transporter receptor subunit TctC
MLAHPSFPVKTAKELISLAKARPGEIIYGSFGAGSSSHFAGALLVAEAKVNMLHVPYKGGGPLAMANVAGEVPIHFGGVATTLQFVKAGRLKALAVTAAKRSAFVPEVPTIPEALGLPTYDITVTFGMLAPSATPKPIIDRLHGELVTILASADFRSRLDTLGVDQTPSMTLEEMRGWLKTETDRWRRIIELTGIRAD